MSLSKSKFWYSAKLFTFFKARCSIAQKFICFYVPFR